MNAAVDLIISLFNLLLSVQIFGVPLLAWAFIPVIVGIVFSFIKKGKSEENEKEK